MDSANESVGLWITVIAVAMIVCSVAGAMTAKWKGRSQLFWFLACFLVPPAVLIILFLPPARGRGYPRRSSIDRDEGNGGLHSPSVIDRLFKRS